MGVLRVRDDLELDERELEVDAGPSSGPGGQHVNRSWTRVTVRFSVSGSPSLTDQQRARILERLAGRISAAGVLRVSSQKHRSQIANRREALARLAALLADALEDDPERLPTRVPRTERRRRRDAKRHRSRVKQLRTPPDASDS